MDVAISHLGPVTCCTTDCPDVIFELRQWFPNVGVQETVIGSETYFFPITFATQKAGPTPRGDFCKLGDPKGINVFPCSDSNTPNNPNVVLPGPIQPNDDRMNQVTYADGLLWSRLNTEVGVVNGIAYFVVAPWWTKSGILGASMSSQGYIAQPTAQTSCSPQSL